LYIATHISDNTFANPEIVKVIFDQKSSLEKLLEVLQPEKNDPNIAELIKDLSGLKASYDKVVEGKMTSEQLDEIIASAGKLREKIVK
jgi:hypothetical protein